MPRQRASYFAQHRPAPGKAPDVQLRSAEIFLPIRSRMPRLASGMPLVVQDLGNSMLAQVSHVLLSAYAGTIMGVETNGSRFFSPSPRNPRPSSIRARFLTPGPCFVSNILYH